jgi:selenocysteine-specific elongation factor
VQFHVGTAAVSANIAMLETTEMTGGQKQFVQIRLASPLQLVPGERFVIRANIADSGVAGLTTIGGGQIIGLSNTRLRRKKQWTLDLLAARSAAINDPLRWCEQMVVESEAPATLASLQKKCWSRAEEITASLEQLRAENRIVAATGGGWIHCDIIRKTAENLGAAIEAFHAANPQRAGFSREELRASLKSNAEILDAAADSLLKSKQLECNGALLARAGWSARLPDRDQQLCDRIAASLLQGGCSPPGLEELASALGEPIQRITSMTRLLAERGVIVRLDDRIWMHRNAVEAGRQTALKMFSAAPAFSTMEFRDALGVSRKFAVPLVDYLDKIRFTVRSGNNRTPGVEAKKLLPQKM